MKPAIRTDVGLGHNGVGEFGRTLDELLQATANQRTVFTRLSAACSLVLI